MLRTTKIAGYLKVMAERGIAAESLLEDSGIDPSRISSPDYLIGMEQHYAVVDNMMRLTGNEGIAFSLGGLASFFDMGIVGYAMMSAKTLREAQNLWLRYNHLAGTAISADALHVTQPGYEVFLSSPAIVGRFMRFETEELLVQGLKLIQDLTGIEPVLGGLTFAYPPPPHRALYDRQFKCPLTFNAPRTSIRYLAPDIDTPVRSTNHELYGICDAYCRQVLQSMHHEDPLRDRLRSLFLTSPAKLPSLKQASASLGLSDRTLSRQLEESGSSFQAIKDEFRYDLAREYLRSGYMSAKQVAYLLGFAAPSSFSRAFKLWSGQTVEQFLDSDAHGRQCRLRG